MTTQAERDRAAGREAAEREIAEDGWTPAMALEYLTTPAPSNVPAFAAFDDGFRARVGELAQKAGVFCKACRTLHTHDDFDDLPELYTQPAADDGYMLVVANCGCGSTISKKVECHR